MPLSSWSCRKWVVPFGQPCVSLLFYIKSSLAFHLDASVRQDPAEALGAQKKLCQLSATRKRIHGRVKWKRTRGEKLLSETKEQDMTVAKDNLTLCGDSGPAYAGSSPAFQGTNAAPFCKPGSWVLLEDVKQFDHQTANPLSWGGAAKVVFASLRVFFHLRILQLKAVLAAFKNQAFRPEGLVSKNRNVFSMASLLTASTVEFAVFQHCGVVKSQLYLSTSMSIFIHLSFFTLSCLIGPTFYLLYFL